MARSGVLGIGLLAGMLGGCTFVRMAPGAQAVQVVASAPIGCEKRGEIAVSVKDRVALYQRNAMQVREELETLARNEAPGLQANRISPLSEPVDGSQRWAAWRCPA